MSESTTTQHTHIHTMKRSASEQSRAKIKHRLVELWFISNNMRYVILNAVLRERALASHIVNYIYMCVYRCTCTAINAMPSHQFSLLSSHSQSVCLSIYLLISYIYTYNSLCHLMRYNDMHLPACLPGFIIVCLQCLYKYIVIFIV